MDLFGKKHAGNLRGRTWNMEEFTGYFGSEGQKKGNSDQFQAVAHALEEVNRLKQGPDTKEHHKAQIEASDRLMKACQAYSESHKNARSSGGRERLAVVEKLSEFQYVQNLENRDQIRDRSWNLEELGNYFRENQELKKSLPEFAAAEQAFEEFVSHQDQVITQESAMAMIKASDKLKKACQAFADTQRGTMLASGLEYQGFIDGLSRFHEELNLDQARDMRVVREHEGKTWGEVGKFKMAEMVLDGNVTVVGANVSQRMKVEHEGRVGFFTERFELKSQGNYLNGLIEEVDRMKDPGLRRALEENKQRLLNRLENMGLNDSMASVSEKLKENSANKLENRVACCIGESWNKMEEDEKGSKEKLGKAMMGNHGTLMKVSGIVKAFQEQVKDDMTQEQKSGLMERMIRENLSKDDKELKQTLTQNKGFLMGVPSPDPWMNPENNMAQFFKLALIEAKAADRNALPLDRLIEDETAVRRFTSTILATRAAQTATAGSFKIDEGIELTSRNIASSRMAELLGIGSIIAHSEKMVVRSGDKVMTGCFMEHAVGLDSDSKSERVQRQFEQVEMIHTAGLTRDSSTLEVFDYLCGQNDRHGKNMFYQLSEPDENGKRHVVGLQGIDSDLAFGDSVKHASRGHGHYTNTVFIDRNLAEKVQKLDRATLEYAIGDLIPEKQIDVMMERVQLFQKHLEDMIIVDPDKWDLKEHSIDEDVTKLTGKDKTYVEGLKRLDRSLHETMYEFNLSHKNGQATMAVESIKRERAKSPKVALSFEELQSRERRDALKREPKFNMAHRRERQMNTPEDAQKSPQERQVAGPHL